MEYKIDNVSLKIGDEFIHCVHSETRIRVEAFATDEATGELTVIYRVIVGRCEGLVKSRSLGAFLGFKMDIKSIGGYPIPTRRYKPVTPDPLSQSQRTLQDDPPSK